MRVSYDVALGRLIRGHTEPLSSGSTPGRRAAV